MSNDSIGIFECSVLIQIHLLDFKSLDKLSANALSRARVRLRSGAWGLSQAEKPDSATVKRSSLSMTPLKPHIPK
jgi:hypothetical protein